jgi:hypothetical protein
MNRILNIIFFVFEGTGQGNGASRYWTYEKQSKCVVDVFCQENKILVTYWIEAWKSRVLYQSFF